MGLGPPLLPHYSIKNSLSPPMQPYGLSPGPAQQIKPACLGNFSLAVGTLLIEVLWILSSQPPPTGVLTEALGLSPVSSVDSYCAVSYDTMAQKVLSSAAWCAVNASHTTGKGQGHEICTACHNSRTVLLVTVPWLLLNNIGM